MINSRFCLIGGGGFIGKNLIRSLCKTAKKIHVIEKVAPAKKHPGIEYHIGDYENENLLADIFSKVDIVIHLAHSTTPQTSFADPVKDILTNLPASVKLFETASRSKLKKLIFISSGGTVYGKTEGIPIKESHPTNPISPYGITKLAIEKYGLMYHIDYGLPLVIIRPSNPYGTEQKPFTGQGFIATAIASILTNKEIKIFGKEGTIRDYLYIDDLVQCITSVIAHGKPGELYNIGSGEGKNNHDVLNFIFTLAKENQLKPRLTVLPARSLDVPYNVLDITKVQQECNWIPKTSFVDGIAKTWQWLSDHRDILL